MIDCGIISDAPVVAVLLHGVAAAVLLVGVHARALVSHHARAGVKEHPRRTEAAVDARAVCTGANRRTAFLGTGAAALLEDHAAAALHGCHVTQKQSLTFRTP